MPWSGDTQSYLDTLYARRAAIVGVKSSSFSDQSTTFELAELNAEIARVERVLRGGSNTRYAATSKGC